MTLVADYLRHWVEEKDASGLKVTTTRMYRAYIENDIIPALGSKHLESLKRADVAGFIDSLAQPRPTKATGLSDIMRYRYAGKPRGATTVRRIHATLSSALTDALTAGVIESNPAHRAQLPEMIPDLTTLSPEDAAKFMDAISGHRMATFFKVAFSTGMRRGELCGLKWEDVDPAARTIRVRRSITQTGHTSTEMTPKHGEYTVPLEAHIARQLNAWKSRQEREGSASPVGRVFTYEDGSDIKPSYPSKLLCTWTARARVPHTTFNLIRLGVLRGRVAAGEPIESAAKSMGMTTLDYASKRLIQEED